jgi:hypothetical protein
VTSSLLWTTKRRRCSIRTIPSTSLSPQTIHHLKQTKIKTVTSCLVVDEPRPRLAQTAIGAQTTLPSFEYSYLYPHLETFVSEYLHNKNSLTISHPVPLRSSCAHIVISTIKSAVNSQVPNDRMGNANKRFLILSFLIIDDMPTLIFVNYPWTVSLCRDKPSLKHSQKK